MTRAEEIESLRTRIVIAERQHKRKTLSILYARLQSLVLRQINAELREERKRAA